MAIKMSPTTVTSTLPMQYGAVMNSPDWYKKKKRKRELEMAVHESGKGRGELDWYKDREKIINPR